MYNKFTTLTFLLATLAAPVAAQPIVDGSISGDGYGMATAVQAVETGFGDNLNELDAAYCTVVGDRLYLALTGNIENNFNSLEIFIDAKAGGENTLTGMPGNDGTSAMAGLTFDAGFAADYHLVARRGNLGGDRFDLDLAELGTANFSSYTDIFGGTDQGSGSTGTGLNAQPIGVAYDDSNVDGVLGGTGAANEGAAAAVSTGLELSIALSDLGHVGGDIKICAFINNADHNFASNQFLGPVQPPQINLGGDGLGTFTGVLDFSLASFAGDQFFICAAGPVTAKSASWSEIKAKW